MEGRKVRRIILWILAILLGFAAIAGAAVGIMLAMRFRFPENTAICGVDVSDMLLEDAELLLEERVKNYTLTVTVGDQVFEITAEELGLAFQAENFRVLEGSFADSAATVDPWSIISLDPGKISACINEKFDEKRIAPVSPVIVLNEATGTFEVIAGSPETWYNRDMLVEPVRNAVASLTPTLEISEDALYQEQHDPALQARAEALAQRANDLVGQQFEYVFSPRRIELGREVIDSATLKSCLRFDLEEDRIYADKEVISSYVESFAPNYECLKYQDRFVTHDGDRIKIRIQVQERTVDIEKMTDLIAECIASGTPGSFDAPYTGALNFGGTYIEVSILQQHLWYYENGEVVLESDVVTGWEGIGRVSPTGVNYVRGHLSDVLLMDLRHSQYWLGITIGGRYGFHDADEWRKPEEYGGSTYHTNGSGGCINVPLVNMEKLYNMVADGTPIVIYNYFHYDG